MGIKDADTIDELLEEAKEMADRTPELPEDPVSITLKGYYKGFSVLITKRNAEGKVDTEGIITAIDNLIERGFKPSWNDGTNGKHLPEEPKPQPKTKPCTFIDAGCTGTMALRSGVSKEGRRWAGWFCNEEKEHVDWVSLTRK